MCVVIKLIWMSVQLDYLITCISNFSLSLFWSVLNSVFTKIQILHLAVFYLVFQSPSFNIQQHAKLVRIHKISHNQTKTTHPIMDILFSFITWFHNLHVSTLWMSTFHVLKLLSLLNFTDPFGHQNYIKDFVSVLLSIN